MSDESLMGGGSEAEPLVFPGGAGGSGPPQSEMVREHAEFNPRGDVWADGKPESVRSSENSEETFLIAADVLLLCLSFFAAEWLEKTIRWPFGAHEQLDFRMQAGAMLLMSSASVLFVNASTPYSQPWNMRPREQLWSLARAISGAGFLLLSVVYLVNPARAPMIFGAAALTLGLGSLALWRVFLRSQPISGLADRRNVLIVGAGSEARALKAYLDDNSHLGYEVKGFLDRRGASSGAAKAVVPVERRRQRPPLHAEGGGTQAKILGRVEDLPWIIRGHFIDELLISVSDCDLMKEVATHAGRSQVSVRVVPDQGQRFTGSMQGSHREHFPTLALRRESAPVSKLIVKRLVDIVASAIALAILFPLMLLVALLVRIDSPGAVFYSSARVGKKGRLFKCHKFRTMVDNAERLRNSLGHLNERDGILFKVANDPRVTRLGRLLRKYSLDELPQFWNVLAGEMSLVGPRPPIPSEYREYELEYLRRLDVAPGLTGLWQVKARQDTSFATYISLDIQYVDNWTFWLDVKLMLQTILVVLEGTGR